MGGDLLFLLGLSLLLTHEMDAVRRHEWRVLPLTAFLDDRRGYIAFTLAHVPLYLLILLVLADPASPARPGLILGLDIFFVVHVGLHIAFQRHPAYEFRGPLSWGLIVGAGLCGALDLLARL